MKLKTIVLATANPHKEKELKRLLGNAANKIKTLKDFNLEAPEETGLTYEENAELKARACFEITGLPSLADDSGLEVEALDNRPGIYSARYGVNKKDREKKLLNELKNKKNRNAKEVCVLAFIHPSVPDKTFLFRHDTRGTITLKPAGEGGFGYDAVFMPANINATLAQLGSHGKDAVSHRGLAMGTFLRWLLRQNEENFGKIAPEEIH